MATDQSKLFSITNKTGRDIVIGLPINTNETTSSNGVKAANGQLELLLTGDGNTTVIKNGSSGTVTLDRNYRPGADEQGYVKAYDLQACDNTWLYPLILLPVTQQTINGSAGFAPRVIKADDLPAMNQAFSFYQTISAYPGSALSKNYMAAMDTAKKDALANADGSADSAKAISGAISETITGFFKSTQEYKEVTLDHVIAVDNYYNNFPAIWAQYRNNLTYYLYGSDGITAFFAGSLSLQKSEGTDITKKNSGYTCLFTPAVDPSDINQSEVNAAKAVQLTYVNGLFVDDPDAVKPKIAFKGSFMLERFFTMDPADSKVVTIVTGNINGILYVGLDTLQQSSDTQPKVTAGALTDAESVIVAYWERITHPKNLTDWVVTVATFAGAALAIPATAYIVYRIYKFAKSTPPAKPINRRAVERGFDIADDEAFANAIKWTGEESLEERSQTMADHYGISIEKISEISLNGDMATWSASVASVQRYCTKELLQYQSIMSPEDVGALQSMLTSIQATEKALVSIPTTSVYRKPELLEQRTGIINRELQNIGEYKAVYERIYKNIEGQVTSKTKEFFEDGRKSIDAYLTDVKKAMEENKEEESELAPELEKEIIPEII